MRPSLSPIVKRLVECIVCATTGICAAQPVSATYLYDITDPVAVTHVEFAVPAILTSLATETEFLVATAQFGTLTALVLDPVPVDNCPNGIPGPCIHFDYIDFTGNPFSVEYGEFGAFTSVGHFSSPRGPTIDISLVQEPSTPVLLLIGLALLVRSRYSSRNLRPGAIAGSSSNPPSSAPASAAAGHLF